VKRIKMSFSKLEMFLARVLSVPGTFLRKIVNLHEKDSSPLSHEEWGESHVRQTGMLVGKFQLKP